MRDNGREEAGIWGSTGGKAFARRVTRPAPKETYGMGVGAWGVGVGVRTGGRKSGRKGARRERWGE